MYVRMYALEPGIMHDTSGRKTKTLEHTSDVKQRRNKKKLDRIYLFGIQNLYQLRIQLNPAMFYWRKNTPDLQYKKLL